MMILASSVADHMMPMKVFRKKLIVGFVAFLSAILSGELIGVELRPVDSLHPFHGNHIYKILDPIPLLNWKDFNGVAEALEGAFWVVRNPEGSPRYRGYSAQGDTYLWEGNSIAGLRFLDVPVTESPRLRKCVDGVTYTESDFLSDANRWDSLPIFNEGGIWLRSGYPITDSSGNTVIRAWYHTESLGCYDPRYSRHSISAVGYAESYDGGKTFVNKSTKPLLGIADKPLLDKFNGVKAATVVSAGLYLYMYFVHDDLETGLPLMHVARSLNTNSSTAGTQGGWTKLYDGRFVNAYDQDSYGKFDPLKTINKDQNNNDNPGVMPGFNRSTSSIVLLWPQEDGISLSEEYQPDGVSFRKVGKYLVFVEGRSNAVRRTIPIFRYYFKDYDDYWMGTSSAYLRGSWTPSEYKPDRNLTPSAFTTYMYQRAEEYNGLETVPVYVCNIDKAKSGQIVKDQVLRVPGVDDVGANGCVDGVDAYRKSASILAHIWPTDSDVSDLPPDVIPVYRYYSTSKRSYLVGTSEVRRKASEALTIGTMIGYAPKYEAGDLIRNVSLVGQDGGKEFEKEFYLFYTLVNKGDENFKRRYIRRKVVVSSASDSNSSAQMSLALYKNRASGDNWATSRLPDEGYRWKQRLGYIFTRSEAEDPDLVPLYDCARRRASGKLDHVLRARAEGCLTGEREVNKLGFIWKTDSVVEDESKRKALYSCFDQATINYSAGNDVSCGLGADAKNSVFLGYVAR